MGDEKRAEELDGQGLGGSDAGPMLNLSRRRTSLDVYLAKLGLIERSTDESDKPWLEWGRRLEPVIAAKYEELTGVELIGDGEERFTHATHAFIKGRPDRLAKSGDLGFEAKTCGIHAYLSDRNEWGPESSDEIPPSYLAQCAWYMGVCDTPVWDLAVLIGGSDFRIYTIRRDAELEADLFGEGFDFWTKNVLGPIPPDCQVNESIARKLRALYPRDNGFIRRATIEERIILEEYRHVKAEFQKYEEKKIRLELLLKACIADATGLEEDDATVTYKANRDTIAVDHEALAEDLERILAKMGLDSGELARLRAKHTRTRKGSRVLRVKFKGNGTEIKTT